ncbi:MAG: hypothetical protein N3F10_07340 [Candidatus Bathyarchaeota archaeon]|nr:hypothetical protein [Candidatus Bathyarchaeota archaeon]
MPKVKAMFQAMFREIVGSREANQEIKDGYTLGDLLNYLAKNMERISTISLTQAPAK